MSLRHKVQEEGAMVLMEWKKIVCSKSIDNKTCADFLTFYFELNTSFLREVFNANEFQIKWSAQFIDSGFQSIK